MAVATNVELPRIVVRRTVAEATPIPMGKTLKFTGTNTAAESAADGDPFAGITTEEFKGGEGITQVSVALDGVWMMDTTGGAIASGNMVSIGGNQQIAKTVGTADLLDGSQFGRAEMTKDGDARIRVRLGGV